MMPKMLYPERRRITEAEVIGWGHDAMVNEAVDEHVKAHGVIEDDAVYAQICDGVERPTYEDAREFLSDRGLATFQRED